jgi:hypothetical protein
MLRKGKEPIACVLATWISRIEPGQIIAQDGPRAPEAWVRAPPEGRQRVDWNVGSRIPSRL